jgi:hypothetical protein
MAKGQIEKGRAIPEAQMQIPQSVCELVAAGRLVHLTTINPDCSPEVTVVWVGIDNDEFVMGHLGMWKESSKHSPGSKSLTANTLRFANGKDALRGLRCIHLLDERRVAIDMSMWIQEYEQAAILMTTPIVTKPAADKHGIQEAAATRDFRQHRIVLLGVWVHCLRPIQGLTRRQHVARPTCQAGGLIFQ